MRFGNRLSCFSALSSSRAVTWFISRHSFQLCNSCVWSSDHVLGGPLYGLCSATHHLQSPTAGTIRTREDGFALILPWSLPSSAVRATPPWHKGERQSFVFFCLSSQSQELSFRTQQINKEKHVLGGVAQVIKRGGVSIWECGMSYTQLPAHG